MIDKMKYVQAAALVKIQEKKLITSSKLNRMIDAIDEKEVLKLLSETEYSKSMLEANNDINKAFEIEMNKAFKFVDELLKEDKEVLQVLKLKYDFQSLKQAFKVYIKDKKESEILEKYTKAFEKALEEYEKK